MKRAVLLLFSFIFLLNACRNNRKKGLVPRDTTVTSSTSFNGVFLDSAQLKKFLDSSVALQKFSEQFEDFYSQRNYTFAWFDSAGLSEQAHNFMNLQENYFNEANDSSLFNAELSTLYDSLLNKRFKRLPNEPRIFQTELLLTGQFFQYAATVYKGSDLNAKDLGWFIPRKKIDLAALLDTALRMKDPVNSSYVPLNPQYKKLQQQLVQYSSWNKKVSWDSLPSLKTPLRENDSAAIVAEIKERLVVLGDLKNPDSSFLFNSELTTAVRAFQHRMGLSEDGVVGNKLIEELNTPLTERIRQLLVNLERVRWMPPETAANYILVNIPEYKMHVYDSGRQQFNMNVIVGSQANNTVIFTGKLQYVVFSPYWNVPVSIVKKELMPAIKKNSNYLAKNNMEITGTTNGIPVIRQNPGPNNSLGQVKFIFPNNYNIYFHDTPNRDLFNRSSRNFSHGCIRVGDPKKLAAYLLRADAAWNTNTIDSAMQQSKEKWVSLKTAIPVFLVYFTAWVDDEGLLHFRKDIYGHDKKMAAKLFDTN